MTGAQEELAIRLLYQAVDCIGCEQLSTQEQELCEDVQLRIERLLKDIKAPHPAPAADLYRRVMTLRAHLEAAVLERDESRHSLRLALEADRPCCETVQYLIRRLQRAWEGAEQAERAWMAAEADYARSLGGAEGQPQCHE